MHIIHAWLLAPRFVLGLLNGGITPALRVCTRDISGERHVQEAMAYVDGERERRKENNRAFVHLFRTQINQLN